MRILHVISSLDAAAGGTTAFVRGLAAAQARAGASVTVLSTWAGETEPRETVDFLAASGVQPKLIGRATGRFARHPELSDRIDAALAECDIVHVHAVWEEAQHLAARSAQRLGIPYVVSPHGMLDPWSLRQNRWAKKLVLGWRVRRNLNRAAAMHYLTDSERDLVAAMKLPGLSIVEPAGLDLDEFDPLPPPGRLRATLAAALPGAAERKIVLFLARVHPKKGLDVLVPAFAEIADPDALLVIAGPDPDGYGDTVREMVRRHGIENRVAFTGMLHGVQRIEALVDADLFVLPSYQENFGIAVIESLAAGTPVLISNRVAIWPELVQAGVAAATDPTVPAFAPELRRWLSDPNLRADAAARCRAFARSRYDWNRIAERWNGHYAPLIEKRN